MFFSFCYVSLFLCWVHISTLIKTTYCPDKKYNVTNESTTPVCGKKKVDRREHEGREHFRPWQTAELGKVI